MPKDTTSEHAGLFSTSTVTPTLNAERQAGRLRIPTFVF